MDIVLDLEGQFKQNIPLWVANKNKPIMRLSQKYLENRCNIVEQRTKSRIVWTRAKGGSEVKYVINSRFGIWLELKWKGGETRHRDWGHGITAVVEWKYLELDLLDVIALNVVEELDFLTTWIVGKENY